MNAEATACDGGFADEKNDLCAGNARAVGNLDRGPGVGVPAGPGRDPFLALLCDRYVWWLAAPFRRGLMAPLRAPLGNRGRGSCPWGRLRRAPSDLPSPSRW